MGDFASEFAFLDDRPPSSDDEDQRLDFDVYLADEPSYVQGIESMPAGEALSMCKFTDANGALYIRAVDAYASSLE